MATFTIDLLTGKVFLFNKNFETSATTSGGTGGDIYQEVNTFNELPNASDNNGEIYIVRESLGAYVINRKEAGLYFSNGSVWRRLGDIPSFFSSENFQVYESSDTGGTTGIQFITSGITQGNFRNLKIQDGDGTIAYLTDLDSKVDTSAFADYTGNTAPNKFVLKDNFTGYTATTEVRLLGIENTLVTRNEFTGFTATTQTKLQPFQANSGSSSIEINNILPTEIPWGNTTFTTNSINYSGGSRIYIVEDGRYEISYVLNSKNNTNTRKSIGTIIRKNGVSDITPMSVATYSHDTNANIGTNVMTEYNLSLSAGDYVELVAFRIGSVGSMTTIPSASWIKLIKIE